MRLQARRHTGRSLAERIDAATAVDHTVDQVDAGLQFGGTLDMSHILAAESGAHSLYRVAADTNQREILERDVQHRPTLLGQGGDPDRSRGVSERAIKP